MWGRKRWLCARHLSSESARLWLAYRASMLALRFAVLSRSMSLPLQDRAGIAVTLLCALVGLPLSGCVPLTVSQTKTQIHLVIDLGSSGTSLCMFPVEIGSQPGTAPRCSVGKLAPVCSKSKGFCGAFARKDS